MLLSAKFLLGVMLLNMTQIVQAALANKLHNTSQVNLRPPRFVRTLLSSCFEILPSLQDFLIETVYTTVMTFLIHALCYVVPSSIAFLLLL